MAEHRLQRAQVGAALQQVGGEGVAQHVRASGRPPRPAVTAWRRTMPHSPIRESRPPRLFRKRHGGRGPAAEPAAHLVQVAPHPVAARPRPSGTSRSLRPLPKQVTQAHARGPRRRAAGRSAPRRAGRSRRAPPGSRGRARPAASPTSGAASSASTWAARQEARQRLEGARRLEVLHRVGVQPALAHREAEEPAHRVHGPRHRARGEPASRSSPMNSARSACRSSRSVAAARARERAQAARCRGRRRGGCWATGRARPAGGRGTRLTSERTGAARLALRRRRPLEAELEAEVQPLMPDVTDVAVVLRLDLQQQR